MLSPVLLALFKALQQGSRQRQSTQDTLGQMFQQGFRPRAGGTGLETTGSGVSGFLQRLFGGGPGVDYSQFEGPPSLVGGPRGSVSRVGDQGRGSVEPIIGEEKATRFNDPTVEQGKLVQVDPETNERKVLGDAPANSGEFVRFVEVGGSIFGVTQGGKTAKILEAPQKPETLEGGDIEVGDSNELGLPPGVYRKKGESFLRVRDLEKPEARSAGDVSEARRAWIELDKALKDEDLTDGQRQKLEALRNELIDTVPNIVHEGLGFGEATSSGEADYVAGGAPDAPSAGGIGRTISDVLADIRKTLGFGGGGGSRGYTGRW